MSRRVGVSWGLLVIAAVLAPADAAHAQLPVCPQPPPDQTYYTACVPGGRLLAARVLLDLAVDHDFKADSDPVLRRAGDVFRSLVAKDDVESNGDLRRYLDQLEPIKLTKLDTATGMLQLNVPDDARTFAGDVKVGDDAHTVRLQLPARLSGGYWRTPDVFQIAFWEGQRATIALRIPSGPEITAEIECLVVSSDGIRAVTTGDTPDLLVRFDDCAG